MICHLFPISSRRYAVFDRVGGAKRSSTREHQRTGGDDTKTSKPPPTVGHPPANLKTDVAERPREYFVCLTQIASVPVYVTGSNHTSCRGLPTPLHPWKPRTRLPSRHPGRDSISVESSQEPEGGRYNPMSGSRPWAHPQHPDRRPNSKLPPAAINNGTRNSETAGKPNLRQARRGKAGNRSGGGKGHREITVRGSVGIFGGCRNESSTSHETRMCDLCTGRADKP